MLWQRTRRKLLGNLFTVLAAVLGLCQVAIGHWVVVVLAGREGPGWALGVPLALALMAANVAAMPILRRAIRRGGRARMLGRAYYSLGLATLFLGLVIGLAWLGWLPLAGALAALGIGPDAAYEIFRVASGGVVLLLAASLVWGFTGGQARIDETHVPVGIVDLGGSLHGLRIVHLTDLHIGNGMEGARLDALVDRVNALEPDLVALTGDLFDHDPRFVPDGARRLGRLRARRGVYAVLGNHDAYTGAEVVARGFAEHAPGLRLLRGDLERVPGEDPFYVAGIDDPGHHWTDGDLVLPELEALAARRPQDGPTLLLVHRPELFPQAVALGFPLMLAGHTHGGQLALPGGGGRWNVASVIFRYHRGLYQQGDSTLYVSRGVGVAGPAIRLNCTREIATIELRRVASARAAEPAHATAKGRAAA